MATAPLRSGFADNSSSRRVLGSPLWYRVGPWPAIRSEEHTSELQSLTNLVCRLLLEKKKSDALRLNTSGLLRLDIAPCAVISSRQQSLQATRQCIVPPHPGIPPVFSHCESWQSCCYT